jgi:hypothetical protein
MYTSPKTFFSVRHTLSRLPYEGKVLCVKRDLGYGDMSSPHLLKVDSGNFLMVTWPSVSLSGDDAHLKMF